MAEPQTGQPVTITTVGHYTGNSTQKMSFLLLSEMRKLLQPILFADSTPMISTTFWLNGDPASALSPLPDKAIEESILGFQCRNNAFISLCVGPCSKCSHQIRVIISSAYLPSSKLLTFLLGFL